MAFSSGLHLLFLRAGLVDTTAGVAVVLALYAYPYMLRAQIGGFISIAARLRECALNLGASPTRVLLTVELPQLVPTLMSGGAVVFLVAFTEYFLVFVVGGGVVPSFAGVLCRRCSRATGRWPHGDLPRRPTGYVRGRGRDDSPRVPASVPAP